MTVQGLSYVRGRVTEETTETSLPAREAGQFDSPFLSVPIRASSDRVQITVGTKFTETLGAVIIYLDPDNSDGADAGVAFSWRDDASNLLDAFYTTAGTILTVRRLNGGSGGTVTASWSFSAADASALYIAWDATTVYAAVDGGTIQSNGNTDIPTLAATAFDAGSEAGASWFEAAYGAVALFNTTLSQTQWETLAALRSRRPPVYGERTDATMSGLWYGAHSRVWSLAASGGAIDLNNPDDSDVLLLGLFGAGIPPVRNRTRQRALHDGVTLVDTQLGARALAIILFLVGQTTWAAWWAKRQEVVGAINPTRGRGIITSAPAEQVYEIDAVLNAPLPFDGPRGNFAQEQSLAFLCDEPAWRVAVQNEQTIDPASGGMSIPLSIPLSITSGVATATVTNDGDLEARPEIVVTVERDLTEDIEVENQTAGQTFVLEGTFDNGDVITIDMDARTAEDAGGVSQMGKRSADSQMWALEPGDNTIAVGVGGGDVSARLRWPTPLAGI